jgi:DNA-binding NtrC family response regulator
MVRNVTTHILLVDAEQILTASMRRSLKERGVSISIAATVDQAVSILDSQPFMDAVLLDVTKRGSEVIDALQSMKHAHPLIEVIVLTTRENLDFAIKAMRLGAFDLLVTPIRIDEFLEKLGEAKAHKCKHQEKILAAQEKMLLLRRGIYPGEAQ